MDSIYEMELTFDLNRIFPEGNSFELRRKKTEPGC